MICYNCGNEVTTAGSNCPFCGAPIDTTQQFNQGTQNRQAPNQNFQQYNQGVQQRPNDSISPATAAVICYLTWVGLLIAILASDRNDPFLKHHLNNSLVIIIASALIGFVAIIPIIGWLVSFAGEIFLVVCFIIGLIGAINGEYKELPIISGIKIIK